MKLHNLNSEASIRLNEAKSKSFWKKNFRDKRRFVIKCKACLTNGNSSAYIVELEPSSQSQILEAV